MTAWALLTVVICATAYLQWVMLDRIFAPRAAASGCVACLPPTVTPNAATGGAQLAVNPGDW